MDHFTEENRSNVENEWVRRFEEEDIHVVCKNNKNDEVEVDKVMKASRFLEDNQYEEDIVDKVKEAIESGRVEFIEVSGHWIIELA